MSSRLLWSLHAEHYLPLMRLFKQRQTQPGRIPKAPVPVHEQDRPDQLGEPRRLQCRRLPTETQFLNEWETLKEFEIVDEDIFIIDEEQEVITGPIEQNENVTVEESE